MPKVLIVEDSPTQALRTRIALESQGFDVVIANESKDAIPVAKQERPDVVLSDVRMPGLDGFQLLQIFRADPELKDTPIILSSATVNDIADRTFAMQHGAHDYIEKGLAPDALANLLKNAMATG